jgi:hypothetical protein
MGKLLFIYVAAMIVLLSWLFSGCSPKVVVQKETVVEYRDRIVVDTATVEIPVEVEKIVTRDTLSHLENKYAKSDAMVSGGMLHHSLESKPQIIKVPVEVHVTDTLCKETQIIEKEVKVDKPLSLWQKAKIGAFWWLLWAVVLLLLWTFRKIIFKII